MAHSGRTTGSWVGPAPIPAVKKTKPKRAATARTAQQNLNPPTRRGGFTGGLVSYTDISKVK